MVLHSSMSITPSLLVSYLLNSSAEPYCSTPSGTFSSLVASSSTMTVLVAPSWGTLSVSSTTLCRLGLSTGSLGANVSDRQSWRLLGLYLLFRVCAEGTVSRRCDYRLHV
ncbi:hypothetical protein MRX96_006650 [Rhipicephalus microplus]